MSRAPRLVQGSPRATQMDGHEQHGNELSGETLGGGDADFGSGVGVERSVSGAWDGAVQHVGDGQHPRTRLPRRAHCCECIGGFAGLAHGDDEVP